jgi:hypothetical protein
MQILHRTFTSSLHIGPSAFYISYTCTPFHKTLLRILQNVMGEFSHRVDMSNFKEKHFLREVMITQLAKMFPTLRESWLFIAVLTGHFHDPRPDRVKCKPQCICFYHQNSYCTQMHTSPSSGVFSPRCRNKILNYLEMYLVLTDCSFLILFDVTHNGKEFP